METGCFFVGVDLGQSRDFTALAVLERAELTGEFDPAMFAWRKKIALRLRCLERAPLGTPYPEIVERVRRTTRSPELAGRCHVAVDATGVGRPVVDLLRRAELGATMLPAIITITISTTLAVDSTCRACCNSDSCTGFLDLEIR